MQRLPRALVFLTLLTLLSQALGAGGLADARPEEVGFSAERLQMLSDTLQAYVDDGKLPGATVLVARHGKVAYFEAFGSRDLENGDPLEKTSIFRIASQTKALVSLAVLMLQEDGELLISDPVSKHIPSFKSMRVAVPDEDGGYQVEPARTAITVRHLLTHTAGLSYGSGPAADQWGDAGIQGWYFANRDEPIRETIDRLAALPLDAQPGERWIYGYSTDILGALVEQVSGMALDAFLAKRVFEPLGMSDTHFYLPPAKKNRLAVVYSKIGDAELRPAPDPGHMVGQGAYVEGPRKSFSGGAGLVSTASDYARFLQMMLNGGELDGKRLISPSTVKLMTVNHVGDKFPWGAGTGFGLGFSVVTDLGARGSHGSIGEYGWGGAYHSTYWVDPAEELVVVYMTQLIPAGNIDDHGKLRALVYSAITNSASDG